MIVITISAPFGGLLADRTGRRDTVSMISLLSYALLLPLALCMPPWAVPVILVVVGLVSGLGAGPIVTLLTLILRPEARAFGMGIFYSICYGEDDGRAPFPFGHSAGRIALWRRCCPKYPRNL